MKIEMERTGGVGNIRLAAAVDTASRQLVFGAARRSRTLAPEEARQLEAGVEAARFFELPSVLRGPRPDPDRFEYTVTLEADGRRHTVRASEAAVPPALRALLDDLTRLAMGKPLSATEGGARR